MEIIEVNKEYMISNFNEFNWDIGDNDIVYLSIQNDRIIGYAIVKMVLTEFRLFKLFVIPDFRKKGIGQMLLNRVNCLSKLYKKKIYVKYIDIDKKIMCDFFCFLYKNNWSFPEITQYLIVLSTRVARKCINSIFTDDFDIVSKNDIKLHSLKDVRRNKKIIDKLIYHPNYSFIMTVIDDENMYDENISLFMVCYGEIVGYMIGRYLDFKKESLRVVDLYSDSKYRHYGLGGYFYIIGIEYLLTVNDRVKTISFYIDSKDKVIYDLYLRFFDESILAVYDVIISDYNAIKDYDKE